MSVEFLNVILLVEDRGHVGLCLGVLLFAPHTAGVVSEVPLAPQVEGEVDDSLLAVQVLLLKKTIRHSLILIVDFQHFISFLTLAELSAIREQDHVTPHSHIGHNITQLT